jgi:hypothetical protein
VVMAIAKVAGAMPVAAEAMVTVSTASNEPGQGRPVMAVLTSAYGEGGGSISQSRSGLVEWARSGSMW